MGKLNSSMLSITSRCNKIYLTKNFSLKSKYGDNSIYFDLDDIENTTGSWDMYGQDEKKRYPAMQEEFFARAGQALSRREAMFAFCLGPGAAAILAWGIRGTKDANLPITKGPQNPAQVGPRGRI